MKADSLGLAGYTPPKIIGYRKFRGFSVSTPNWVRCNMNNDRVRFVSNPGGAFLVVGKTHVMRFLVIGLIFFLILWYIFKFILTKPAL